MGELSPARPTAPIRSPGRLHYVGRRTRSFFAAGCQRNPRPQPLLPTGWFGPFGPHGGPGAWLAPWPVARSARSARSQLEAVWKDKLRVEPDKQEQRISFSGGAELNFPGVGQLQAREILLWIAEKPQAAANQPSDLRPNRMSARDDVHLNSPQLSAKVQQLEVWFEGARDEGRGTGAVVEKSPGTAVPGSPAATAAQPPPQPNPQPASRVGSGSSTTTPTERSTATPTNTPATLRGRWPTAPCPDIAGPGPAADRRLQPFDRGRRRFRGNAKLRAQPAAVADPRRSARRGRRVDAQCHGNSHRSAGAFRGSRIGVDRREHQPQPPAHPAVDRRPRSDGSIAGVGRLAGAIARPNWSDDRRLAAANGVRRPHGHVRAER